MPLRAALLLLFVGSAWGASFLMIRVAVEEVGPAQLVFFRCVAGAVVLLGVSYVGRRPLGLTRANLGKAALLALLAILAPFFLITWAQTKIESGPAAVLNATMPLFTLFFAAVFLAEERLSFERSAGVILGLIGVVILIAREFDSVGSSSELAAAAVVLASACYGLSAVMARRLIQAWNPLSLSTAMVCLTAVYSGAIFFATNTPELDLQWDTWLSLFLLGAVGTGIAYIAYYTLIEMVSSVRATMVAYIIPVVGVVLGALVLDETVAWNTFVGGAVILAGVALGSGSLNRLLVSRTSRQQPALVGEPEASDGTGR
jgi:drug/metabolite transporter (DMT)-like permease